MLTINLSTLRCGLSPLAREALDAAAELGFATAATTLYRWARRKADDNRQPDDKRQAAQQLADKLAEHALNQFSLA